MLAVDPEKIEGGCFGTASRRAQRGPLLRLPKAARRKLTDVIERLNLLRLPLPL
jgi:hypothetical protein